MRLFFAILILISLVQPVCAQSQEKDSLVLLLETAEPDTMKVKILNRLAYLLHRPEPQQGIIYASESIELAMELDYEKGLAHGYNSLGACYWNKSDLDSALKYYGKSYEINEKLGSARGTTGALSNMAIIYNDRGDYVNAIDTYTRALEEMRKEGFDSYLAITSNNLGLVFEKIANYPEALKWFKEAIKIGEPLGMTNLTGPAWINVGNVYSYTGEPELELEAKKTALEIGKKFDDKYIMGLAFNNLGNVYKRRGEFEQALDHFRQALSINTEVGRKTSIALNLSNIGSTYRDIGSYDESMIQLKRALAIAQEIGHERRISRVNYQLALTAKESSGCDAAISYLLDGLKVAEEDDNLQDVRDINKVLHECYLSKGDYNSALVYHTAYTSAKDSILNAENIKELAKVEAQYKYESQLKEKNTEIELLESKEQLANLKVTLLVIGVILVVIVAFFVSRMMILKKERRKRELESIAKFRESMTGMIAHDLKTPLSVIMNSPGGEEANKHMAGQMLQLINNMLDVHRFESTDVSVKMEQVSFLETLEEARMQTNSLLQEKDLTLEVALDSDYLVETDKSILLRILVNLLTNAIKYSPFDEVITISCQMKDPYITVSVSDNGVGIPENQRETIFSSFGQLDPKDLGGVGSTGLGLTFVKLALEALESDIQVDSTVGKGTTFSFDLPLIKALRKGEHKGSEELEMSEETMKSLSKRIDHLREMDLHQVGAIENELSQLRGESDEVDEWVELVLKSVYAGNRNKFKKLLEI